MKSTFLLLILTFGCVLVNAQTNSINNLENGLALSGYDPISYFEGEPLEGKSTINYSYESARYYFSSYENLNKFKNAPLKYVPQYGGWCAYAMGKDGSKVKIDPETYKIKNGKLYLFYNFGFTNTLNSWNKDEENLRVAADKYWNKLLKK